MALQQFVNQISKQAPTDTTSEALDSMMPIGRAEVDDDTPKKTTGGEPKPITPHETSTISHSNDGPSPRLSEQDCETMTALAAVQIKYGRPQEAIPYLMMVRRNDPTDAEASRLLALALMKMGNWEQAEIIMNELHDIPNADTSRILLLYRSIVSFKQRNFDAARGWLQRFRNFVSGAIS